MITLLVNSSLTLPALVFIDYQVLTLPTLLSRCILSYLEPLASIHTHTQTYTIMAPWHDIPTSPVWFLNFDGAFTHPPITPPQSSNTPKQQQQQQSSSTDNTTTDSSNNNTTIHNNNNDDNTDSSRPSPTRPPTTPPVSRHPSRTLFQSGRGQKHYKGGYFPSVRGNQAIEEVRDAKRRLLVERMREKRRGRGSGSDSEEDDIGSEKGLEADGTNGNDNGNGSSCDDGATHIMAAAAAGMETSPMLPHYSAGTRARYTFVVRNLVLMPPPLPLPRARNGITINHDDSVDISMTPPPPPPQPRTQPSHAHAHASAVTSATRIYSLRLHAQLTRAKLALEPEEAGGEALSVEEYARLERLRRVFREQGNTAECRPPMGMQAGVGEWR